MSIDSSVLKRKKGEFQAYNERLDIKARSIIAHGYLTNSKRPESFVKGFYPTHLTVANGCKCEDTEGNEYIDFICGLGTNLVGNKNEHITRALKHAIDQGTSFSLATQLEIEVGELIQEMFPFVERMRFLKTGSEACSAAVRIARAYTGRKWILSSDYHGWHDIFTYLTPPANGVEDSFKIQRLNDHDAPLLSETAAVIIEPIVTDWSEERRKEVSELVALCRRHDIMVIFDETITGLRFPKHSVASYWGIHPDLFIFGKALGNGLPISCVGGRKEVMETDYFVSSTFSGDTLSLSAARAVLTLLKSSSYYNIDTLWSAGFNFQNRFNKLTSGITGIEGYPTRGVLKRTPDSELWAIFMQECCRAGILFGPSVFLCFQHIREFESILSTVGDICEKIKRGECSLEGIIPQTPFAQKVRGQ